LQPELLEWFDGQLAIWIKSVPLTPQVKHDRYSLADYQSMTSTLAARGATSWGFRHSFRDEQERLFEIDGTLRSTHPSFFFHKFEDIEALRKQIFRVAESLEKEHEPMQFSKAMDALDQMQSMVTRWSTMGEVVAEPPKGQVPDPLTIPDPWQRALAWIRLERFDKASDLVESAFLAAPGERERFELKFELAGALAQVRNYPVAIGLLEQLSEQIDELHLLEAEGPVFVARIWKLLRDCYKGSNKHADKIAAVEVKLIRAAPWQLLRDTGTK
jgi:tetratricopeptide (TPR) repeat protein